MHGLATLGRAGALYAASQSEASEMDVNPTSQRTSCLHAVSVKRSAVALYSPLPDMALLELVVAAWASL